MLRKYLQHSFRSLTFSGIISNLVKATLCIPRYESKAVVGRRYSDSKGVGQFWVQTPVRGKRFSVPHIRLSRPAGGSTQRPVLYNGYVGPFRGLKRFGVALNPLPTLRSSGALYTRLPYAFILSLWGDIYRYKIKKISWCLSVLPYCALAGAPCTSLGNHKVS